MSSDLFRKSDSSIRVAVSSSEFCRSFAECGAQHAPPCFSHVMSAARPASDKRSETAPSSILSNRLQSQQFSGIFSTGASACSREPRRACAATSASPTAAKPQACALHKRPDKSVPLCSRLACSFFRNAQMGHPCCFPRSSRTDLYSAIACFRNDLSPGHTTCAVNRKVRFSCETPRPSELSFGGMVCVRHLQSGAAYWRLGGDGTSNELSCLGTTGDDLAARTWRLEQRL